MDDWWEWASFIATCLVAYAALHGSRLVAERFLLRWSDRARFRASAVLGVLMGGLFVIASRLSNRVSILLIFTAIGVYVGLLLAGGGWRHHIGTRLIFWVGAFAVIGAWRLVM